MKPAPWLAAIACGACTTGAAADLVVHEWGTITTVHATDGTPQGGLNRIEPEEVLPGFVHRYEPDATRHDPKLRLGKRPGITGRPDVTMRLETPVVYFHPPAKAHYDVPMTVKVRFRGGVINEFYPRATAGILLDTDRLQDKLREGVITGAQWNGLKLDNYVVSSLQWQGVKLHDTVVAPLTSNPVWLAPREVQSASVFLAEAGEGERYLFYRGVAHLAALLQTRHSRGSVQLHTPAQLAWLDAERATLPLVWLVEVRADGSIAFREHGALTLRKGAEGKELARLRRFGAADYASGGRALRESIKLALIKEGLFADEAQAMLETWKASWFEKAGLRVFYVVPRTWVDYFLPLDISVPSRLSRAFIGRIDLLGPGAPASAGAR